MHVTSLTDEGGRIVAPYRVIPGTSGAELEITHDDRDDGFSAAPGIHVTRCTSLRLAQAANGLMIPYPENCH
jgi:hypothetical protein